MGKAASTLLRNKPGSPSIYKGSSSPLNINKRDALVELQIVGNRYFWRRSLAKRRAQDQAWYSCRQKLESLLQVLTNSFDIPSVPASIKVKAWPLERLIQRHMPAPVKPISRTIPANRGEYYQKRQACSLIAEKARISISQTKAIQRAIAILIAETKRHVDRRNHRCLTRWTTPRRGHEKGGSLRANHIDFTAPRHEIGRNALPEVRKEQKDARDRSVKQE